MKKSSLLSGAEFSSEQLAAITHKNGPMMVVAGPGSGKTTVITERIKYLIESAGVSPADILVITFTRAAAGEMSARFKSLTEGKEYPVRFGTFHSIFFWIIKTAYHLNNDSILSEEEKRKLVDRFIQESGIQYENREDIVSSAISQISLVKCDMIQIDNYYSHDMPEDAFRTLYMRLEKELKRMGKLDFDDMMVMCYDLLTKREDILNQCRRLFPYIMVDEFQDSNKLQYEIFKLLAFPKKNAFIVGDDDQSVYGFRGARPEIMQQFKKDFRGTKEVLLGTNYRCAKAITKAASCVIANNKNRFDKTIKASREEQGVVRLLEVKDGNRENDEVLRMIREAYSAGIPYQKQAVLYRTNIQPRRLVYKLDRLGIPYSISDSMPNIFEHFVIQNILDYFYLALGDWSRARFLRIMNKPSRYINRDALLEDPVDFDTLRYRFREKDYIVEHLDKLSSDLKWISRMRPFAALNYIRKSVGYDAYLKDYAEYRQMDLDSLYEVLDEFAAILSELSSYGELFEYIDDYAELLKKQQEHKKTREGVNLMTMHSAKGLEFDIVYILDAVEGMSPYKKAKTAQEIEEERRMFYVAMTRARNALHIFIPKQLAGKETEPSRYIGEITVKNMYTVSHL